MGQRKQPFTTRRNRRTPMGNYRRTKHKTKARIHLHQVVCYIISNFSPKPHLVSKLLVPLKSEINCWFNLKETGGRNATQHFIFKLNINLHHWLSILYCHSSVYLLIKYKTHLKSQANNYSDQVTWWRLSCRLYDIECNTDFNSRKHVYWSYSHIEWFYYYGGIIIFMHVGW